MFVWYMFDRNKYIYPANFVCVCVSTEICKNLEYAKMYTKDR